MKIAVLLWLMIFAAGNLKGQNTAAQANIWKEISTFFSPPKEFKNNYGAYRSPFKFYDGHTVKTSKDWKRRRAEILNQWNELMGKWPELLTDQQMKILDTVRKDGFTQFRVSFYWTPNEETYGYLLVPDGKERKPAVITVYYEPETAIGLGDSSHPFRDFACQLAKKG